MKTAKDFAALAAALSKSATDTNPADGAPCEQSRKLIVFHLRTAAKTAREVSDFLFKQEPPQ